MKIEIEFSKETSVKWDSMDVMNRCLFRHATAYINNIIRYRGFATYQDMVAELGIAFDRKLVACGWTELDSFYINTVRNADGSYILEMEVVEDIRDQN